MDESTTNSESEIPPGTALRSLIALQGRHICDSPTHLSSHLATGCPGQPDQVALLLRAQEARIPGDLIWSQAVPRADLGNRLVARLQSRYSFSETDAQWAVVTWMDALDSKTPRPRIKPVLQVASSIPADSGDAKIASPATAALPGSSMSPTSEVKKAPMPQKSTTVQNPTRSTAPTSPSRVPNWVVGAVALVFILCLGIFVYISTGPPPSPTHAPAVVYNLPAKTPAQLVHRRPMLIRHPR